MAELVLVRSMRITRSQSSPSEETQQRIAAFIRERGRIPLLDAYVWTLRELERLAAAADAYRRAHDGKPAQGLAPLLHTIRDLRRRQTTGPQRRLGWRKNYSEIRVTGVDIDRTRH